MLLVVEGMDRTGKSSLCKRLAQLHGGKIIHFSAPRDDAIVEYLRPIRDYLPGGGRDVYLDRHYLGETVWPEFFGRPSRMTRIERECIETVLEEKGALCVLALRDPDDLERACLAEDEPSAGRAAATQLRFVESSQLSLVPWWYYTHGDDLSDLTAHARDLERYAAERRV